MKLSLAYSFRNLFFICQNLKHVYKTYSFLELFILTLVKIFCLEFISHHIKGILWVNPNSKGNQSWNKNTCFWYYDEISWCWNILNFSQLHEHNFRSSRSQIFFKIGPPKNFAIFRFKKRRQYRRFPVNMAKFFRADFS